MTAIINPNQLVPKRVKVVDSRYRGSKYYHGFLNKATRMAFFRASEAQAYAERCKARWIRLYDARILAMVQGGTPA